MYNLKYNSKLAISNNFDKQFVYYKVTVKMVNFITTTYYYYY